jgi:hypothetical protein
MNFTSLDALFAQIINIPLINPLSYVYVVLNLVLLIFASFFGGAQTTDGTGGSLFGLFG